MYIMAQDGKQIINSEFVERFCITVKPDAVLIVASYSDVRPPVTMARYEQSEDPKNVLADLMYSIAGGNQFYIMPESKITSPETTIKDARVKRKGGS